MRLDKLLSNLGYCSRKDTRKFMRMHEVLSNGAVVTRSDERVVPSQVTIDGDSIDPPPPLILKLHKPVGYVCTFSPAEGSTVYELLPERFARRNPKLVCIGRLDKDTSGLLLLSDDGALVHRLTSPKHKVEKTYEVTLARPLQGDEANLFASGSMMLEGEEKPLMPAKLTQQGECQAEVVVTEGRYHQIRRMFAAVGNHVVSLKRVSVGGLDLADVPEGEFVIIPPQQAQSIVQ